MGATAQPKKGYCTYCPVLFVVVLVSFIYAVFLALNLVPMIQDEHTRTTGIVLTATFHVLFLLFIVSGLRTSFTRPGAIPASAPWKPNSFDENGEPSFHEDENADQVVLKHHSLSTEQRKHDGKRRFCRKCDRFKPDRSHHCRSCESCVLKMDHHCPWVNNCVGYHNHKYFVLFIFYAFSCSAFVLGAMAFRLKSALHPVWDVAHFLRTDFLVILAYFLDALLSLALGLFTSFHIYLVLSGTTTIEFCEKKRGDRDRQAQFEKEHKMFEWGLFGNWKHVFGSNPLVWFLPTRNMCGMHRNFPAHLSQDGCYMVKHIKYKRRKSRRSVV